MYFLIELAGGNVVHFAHIKAQGASLGESETRRFARHRGRNGIGGGSRLAERGHVQLREDNRFGKLVGTVGLPECIADEVDVVNRNGVLKRTISRDWPERLLGPPFQRVAEVINAHKTPNRACRRRIDGRGQIAAGNRRRCQRQHRRWRFTEASGRNLIDIVGIVHLA